MLLYDVNQTVGVRVAGNDLGGSSSDRFYVPFGIFVDPANTVYVVERGNHRMMKWIKGATSGIRIAGNGTQENSLTQLNVPTFVTGDTNNYIYISELQNY